MHKKSYLRKVCGSVALFDNIDFVLYIASATYYNEKAEILEKFHGIIFRISSRFLTRIFRDSYPKKDYRKIARKFKELCVIKNRYWRAYQKLTKTV
jgi:hypothetical protein